MPPRVPLSAVALCLAFAPGFAVPARAAEPGAEVQQLIEQNRRLEDQVRTQQKTIDALSAAIAEMRGTTERQERALKGLEQRVDAGASPDTASDADRQHDVHVAAEAGLAFFNSGAEGQFPNAEFRVDDPVISVEAPVWKNTFFYGELKLLTREASNDSFQLGELYADFEDVSELWGRPGLLSFRMGRINTPFGEEYQVRGPVENPLISHSLSDLWGTDEGAEIYGSVGPARYVLAVQNGGVSRLHDFNPDKAVVGRVGWDPTDWLHLSGSAMRTGELAVQGDNLSDLWFANGFFRSIGAPATTRNFWADLGEADARAHWTGGHASVALGAIRYDDDDRAADHARRIRYGYVELVQAIIDRLYGAARYSEIHAPGGYPMAGAGTMSDYFFRPTLTESLRRLSVGLDYIPAAPLVFKVEYSWNAGRLLGGASRRQEDFFGSEIGVKF